MRGEVDVAESERRREVERVETCATKSSKIFRFVYLVVEVGCDAWS
jgi:hypothetical protein